MPWVNCMHATASRASRLARVLRRSILLQFVPVVAMLCVMVIAAITVYQDDQALRRSAVNHVLALQRMIIDSALQLAEEDLATLLADGDLSALLTNGKTAHRDALIRTLLALLDVNRKYDRIRVLDRHGSQLIRIDGGGSIGAPVVSAGVSSGSVSDVPRPGFTDQWFSAVLHGELSILPIRNDTRQTPDGSLPAVILPLSVVVTDMQGHYLGRVTLDVQLAQMFEGLRRAGADLGESLLLDGREKLLLGSDANAELSDYSAFASTGMVSDGDGHVRTAGGEYVFATLVYRSPRPLRSHGDFLEPPGTPAGNNTGVFKTVIFRPFDPIRVATPLIAYGLIVAALLGIAGMTYARKNDRRLRVEGIPRTLSDVDRHPHSFTGSDDPVRRDNVFLKRILNTVPQPIFVKDRQGRYVFLNDAACEMMGYRREDMLGRSSHTFFPKEQADCFVAGDGEVLGSTHRTLHEEALTDARGEVHVILSRKAACTDASGNDIVVGVITDITERKRAEDMLRLSAEVFDHSAEGILITDNRGIILNVNTAFTRITGYSAAEAIGQNARMLTSGKHKRAFFVNIFRSIRNDGSWGGEIINRRKDGELYVVEMSICAVRGDDGGIRRYIGMMSDITHRKSTEERMRYLAQHDFLTGLANRHLLQDRVSQAILHAQRSRRKVGLLLLDLDGFKDVNDRFGHEAGDQVLKDVAARLTLLVRQTDTVARIGGDEFVAVLPGLRSWSDAERIARKVVYEVSRPYTVTDGLALVGCSIGIALYPDDGEDWATLHRVADRAMYREKHGRTKRTSVLQQA